MTEPRKRSAVETWRALEEMADDAEEEAKIDAEMERILALSPDQVARELVDAGFDAEAVRARGEALGREAAAREAAAREAAPVAMPSPASVRSIAPRRRGVARTVLLLAAALAVAAVLVVAGAFLWNSRSDNVAAPNLHPDPPPEPPPPAK